MTVNAGNRTVQQTGGPLVSYAGVENLDVNANGADAAFIATAGDDVVDVTPTGADAVTVRVNDSDPTVNFSNVGATFTVDGGVGAANTLNLHGTPTPDTFNLSRTIGALTLELVGRQVVTPTASFFSWNVLGGDNRDTFNINEPGGIVGIEVNIDAGAGVGDAINYTTGFSQTYRPGTTNDSGTVDSGFGGQVNFSGIDAVTVTFTVQTIATVQAGGGANQITATGTDADSVAVTVDNGPLVTFNALTVLNLNGNSGDDVIAVTPNALAITSITVNGNDPTASDTVVVTGTVGQDAVTVTPTAADGATVTGLATPITVNTTEHLVYDGLGGDDAFGVVGTGGSDTVVHTPGAVADAGRVRVNSLLGVNYQNLGAAGVVNLSGGSDGTDVLVVDGTQNNDTFTVTATTVTLAGHVVLNEVNFENLTLRGLDGDDQFDIPGGHGYTTINVEGGNPSGGSDFVNLTGSPGAVANTVTIRPDAVNPTEQDVTGLGGTINVAGAELIRFTGVGGPTNDTLIVVTGDQNDTVRLDGGVGFDQVTSSSLPSIQYGNLDDFTLDIVVGIDVATINLSFLNGAIDHFVNASISDTVIFEGAGDDDTWRLINPVGGNRLTVEDNSVDHTGAEVTVIGVPQNIQLNTLGGDDTVTVDVSVDGPIPLPLTYDGGLGRDTLIVTGTPPGPDPFDSVTYTPGPSVDQGRLAYVDGGVTEMRIDFRNLEPVVDLVLAATLVVNGTNANNAINYSPGSIAANGLVSVDAFETIEFSNKTTLTINGLAGSDTINLNNLATPAGLMGVTVDGGDPTESDKLIVNGLFGGSTVDFAATSPATGTINVLTLPLTTYSRVEAVTYVGKGNGDFVTVTTPGGAEIDYHPGATQDSGIITQLGFIANTALTPFEFLNLGTGAQVTFATGGGRVSGLNIHGTANDDQFDVLANGDVTVTKQALFPIPVTPLLRTPGIALLRLYGLEGDDVFNVPGNHVFTTGIQVQGGDPSASDVLDFTGSGANPVTVDFQAGTIQQTTFSAVSFTGVEILNANAAGQNLTVNATAGDDVLSVTPTGTNAATIRLLSSNPDVGATPVVNASNVATLSAGLGAGSDRLVVNGTQAGETITVTGTLVTVGALETVNFTGAEDLHVQGQAGNDTFNVSATPLVSIFILGGDPIGQTAGDFLLVNALGNMLTPEAGPENDSGGFVIGGGNQRVSFDEIEEIAVVNPGPGILILGTNGDDDITVIARDASTHPLPGVNGVQDFTVSVNQGPNVLYIDTPALFIDALAGDDDIVVRAPAPNNAVWDVDITVAGGPPASATGDQGDVLEFETPGAAVTVTFTPTGPETGTLVLNQALTSTINMVSSFTFGAYTSSPGGIEHVVYDGLSSAGTDTLTVNGTNADETLVFGTQSFGGTFRSNFSPSLDFSRTGNVTFNGGGGFDVANLLGSEGIDNVSSTATVITMASPGALVNLTIGTGVDLVNVATLSSNDNIDLDLNVAGLQKAVNAGNGNDTVNLLGTLDATIVGGLGDDLLTGSPIADLIYGDDPLGSGGGNDTLVGADGNDTIFGGVGNDIFGNPSAAFNGVADDPGNDVFFGESGSDLFFWEPGDGDDTVEGGAGDSDQIFFSGNGGAEQFFLFADTAAPARFHLFRVQASIDIDAADVEEVNLQTLGGTDTVTIGRSDTGVLSDLTTTTVRAVDVSLGGDGAADSVVFEGRPADDDLLASVSAGIIKVTGLSYDLRIDGADAAALDRLTINGNEGNDTIKVTPGVETAIGITLNGGVGNDYLSADAILNGDAGNDTLVGGAGNDTMDGGAGDDVFVGNGGTDAVTGGSDGDTILVLATATNDTINLTLNGAGHLLATVNAVTTTYTNGVGGPIATSGVEGIQVDGLGGRDALTVNSTNGAIPLAVTYDGGDNNDTLTLTGGVATSDVYTPGPNPGQGLSVIVIGGVTQSVTFYDIEPVLDLVGGPLVVNADNADNAINYSLAANPANGLVSVDGFETIEFSNKTTLTLNGLAGRDVFNIGALGVPTGLTAVNVDGGDPTSDDQLIVNGFFGGADVNFAPTASDTGSFQVTFPAGQPVVNYTRTESVLYVGRSGGDDLTITSPMGGAEISFVPGANADDGVVTQLGFAASSSLTPFEFRDIGILGSLTFVNTGGGRSSGLNVHGTTNDDRFAVTAAGVVNLTKVNLPAPLAPPLNTPGVAVLRLLGLEGEDVFNVPGNHPFPDGIFAEGGSGVDTVNFTASAVVANVITVDFGAGTVQEATFGPVGTSAVEVLNATAATHDLTLLGSTGHDSVAVSPIGDNSVSAVLGASTPALPDRPVVNALAVGVLMVDLLGGTDNLTVNGTAASEEIALSSNAVAVGGQEQVNVSGVENLRVNAHGGDDFIRVTASDTTTLSVDGGDGSNNLLTDTSGLPTRLDHRVVHIVGRRAVSFTAISDARLAPNSIADARAIILPEYTGRKFRLRKLPKGAKFRRVSEVIRILNRSAVTTLGGPITLVFHGLRAGITLVNATGTTAGGLPFIRIDPTDNGFLPGQDIPVKLLFRLGGKAIRSRRITYSVVGHIGTGAL